MTLEESWELKPGDKVKVLDTYYYKDYIGKIGIVPFMDRIYDDERIPVQFHANQFGYNELKWEDLEKVV